MHLQNKTVVRFQFSRSVLQNKSHRYIKLLGRRTDDWSALCWSEKTNTFLQCTCCHRSGMPRADFQNPGLGVVSWLTLVEDGAFEYSLHEQAACRNAADHGWNFWKTHICLHIPNYGKDAHYYNPSNIFLWSENDSTRGLSHRCRWNSGIPEGRFISSE